MKKGFTLIELLAVIIIIGLIAIIAVPTVYNILKESKSDLYNEQVAQIESAAKRWAVDNASENYYSVSISNLIDGGYLENKTIKDPRNNNEMNGCVIIEYDDTHQQYTYEYRTSC